MPTFAETRKDMTQGTRISLIILLLASAGNLACILSGNGAVSAFKAILMPSLAMAVRFAMPDGMKRLRSLTIAALLLCWTGDMLLEFSGPAYFMAGMGAFMLGHVCYICGIAGETGRYYGAPHIRRALPCRLIIALCCMAAGYAISFGIFHRDGIMGIGVAGYAAVLIGHFSTACLAAIRRAKTAARHSSDSHSNKRMSASHKKGSHPVGWLLVGASGVLTFILSDSLIAVKIFSGIDFAGRNFWVMATYIAAQAMICTGIVRGYAQD